MKCLQKRIGYRIFGGSLVTVVCDSSIYRQNWCGFCFVFGFFLPNSPRTPRSGAERGSERGSVWDADALLSRGPGLCSQAGSRMDAHRPVLVNMFSFAALGQLLRVEEAE